MEAASDGLSPSIRSLLREHRRRKLGGYTLSQCRAERIRVQTLDDSEALAVRKVTNRSEADSLPVMTVERVSDNFSPTEGDDLHYKPGRRRSCYALRSLDHAGKTGVGSTHVSEDSLEKKYFGCDTSPISAEMNVPFEKLPDIDARKVCETPKKKASQGDQNLSRANRKTMHEFQSPLTRGKTKKLSITSPELLNLKRSSSGRVLIPPLDKWRQQGIIYDMVVEFDSPEDLLSNEESAFSKMVQSTGAANAQYLKEASQDGEREGSFTSRR